MDPLALRLTLTRSRAIGLRSGALGLAVALCVALLPPAAGPTQGASSPAPAEADARRAGDPIPGRVLVRFDAAASAATRAKARAAVGGRTIRDFRSVPGLQLLATDESPAAAAVLLARQPGVRYAEPDRWVGPAATPDDPMFGSQWPLEDTADADIDATAAWDVTTGDASVVVAVIDTGVDLDHEDLAANIWTNSAETAGNGVDDDDNGFVDDVHGWDFADRDADPSDEYFHGTHVAGIIGAVGDNGTGIAGVAWNSRIMALRTLGSSGFGSISDGAAAIEYAWRNGARVANLSWGYTGGTSQTLEDAIRTAGEHGMLVVAAAGNAGQDTDVQPFYPAAFDVDRMISVAATDKDTLWSGSNRGRASVDLAAPGVAVLSTLMNDTYGAATGTSMAAPHVAGVAALLLAAHPDWTVDQVRDRILDSVRPIGGLAGTSATGGMLNAATALGGAPDAPPVVEIISPVARSSVLPGTTVVFGGTAVDPEDGNVASGLAWRSSVQGALGTGASISRADLVSGTHLITAMAVDSAGHRPVRAVELSVGPVLSTVATQSSDIDPSIVIAADGTPSIAFSRHGTGTFVSTRGATGTWSSKLVAPAFDHRWVDVAVGGGGQPVVAIQRMWSSVKVYADPGILLAERDGTAWNVERATESCTDGVEGCGYDWNPSLVVGSDGREHVAFVRAAPFMSGPMLSATQIRVTSRTTTGAWRRSLVRAGTQQSAPSLAIGPNGKLHVAWMEYVGPEAGIWYATDSTGSWVSTRLSTATTDRSPQVAVDSLGRVWLVYGSNGGVALRTRAGATFGAPVVISSERAGALDLAIADDDTVHVTVGRVDLTDAVTGIGYLTNRTGSWASHTIATGQYLEPSIALDAADQVHLAYRAGAPTPGIRYTTNAGGSWTTKSVVADHSFGEPAHAVDGRGVAHAAVSRHGIQPGIWYGTNEGSWSLSRITTLTADYSGGVGLAVSSIGEAHVVYGTGPTFGGPPVPDPGVFYATNGGGTWKATRLGNSGGLYPRPIVLDPAGRGHVAFIGQEGGTPGLFYATNASGSWITTRLTTGSYGDPSIALDATGRVHLAATQRVGGSWWVVYLRRSGSGSWTTTTVSSGAIDGDTAIAIDPEGEPSIAYRRTNAGIRLAELRGATWATRVVTSDPVAIQPDIVIDTSGKRHVAYVLSTYDYARCDVPDCPDYPGVFHATGGPTGSFATERVSSDGSDVLLDLVRGRDGSLSVLISRLEVALLEARLQRPIPKAATTIADQSPPSAGHGATINLSARLTAGTTPLAGRTLVFKIDGVQVGAATTDANGVATRSWLVTVAAGTHYLTVGYAGAAGYLASRAGPRVFTVGP